MRKLPHIAAYEQMPSTGTTGPGKFLYGLAKASLS
jgi:hypothetical protein